MLYALACLPLSSACLDATTIPHASGAWSRIFHLMQVCCLPWCPVLCVLRAWLLGVCVGLALLCALWPGAVGLCFALLPGGVALLCLPCGLGLYVDLVHGPLISPCYMAYLRPCIPGLIWASEKRLYFRPNFSAMYFPDIFYGFYFPTFFLA